MSRSEVPFFNRDSTHKAINDIAKSDKLTIVVGAGVSAEVGLPNWDELIRGLLTQVAQAKGLTAEHLIDEFCEATTRSMEPVAAASIAKANLTKRQYQSAIRECLYGSPVQERAPGETAKALALLALSFGKGCEVLTLNMDDLMERALRDALSADAGSHRQWSGVNTVAGKGAGPKGAFVVRHLHGFVPPSGRARGPVILAEPEYVASQQPHAWQEEYVRRRLESSRCLFVGSSLRDPNLLRYLHLAESSEDHIAVFVRQAEALQLDRLSVDVRRARQEATQARWDALTLRPLEADYFIQVAQLVREVVYRREGLGQRSYRERLGDWAEQMESSLLYAGDQSVYRDNQDALQERLAEIVAQVSQWLHRRGVPPGHDEQFGLSMWIRRPSDRALLNWAGSDRSWRAPETLQPVDIHWGTGWVAIDAFCQGTVVVTGTEEEHLTRWNHVLGVPVFLEQAAWGRLPVGVLTFTSTVHPSESVLRRLDDDGQRELGGFLSELGAELLEP